jgi:hypothetical protein
MIPGYRHAPLWWRNRVMHRRYKACTVASIGARTFLQCVARFKKTSYNTALPLSILALSIASARAPLMPAEVPRPGALM